MATPLSERPATPLISQEVFDQYAANWLAVCTNPSGAALAAAFLLADGKSRLVALDFPLQAMLDVASAVGARYIKVRFLATADTASAHFTVALFATDAEHNRLTSYYLANKYWEPGFLEPLLVEVPSLLGQEWTSAWGTVEGNPVSAAMFTTSGGTLRGFNFEVEDFLQLLMPLTAENDVLLQVQLCQHTYYAPGEEADALRKVFGVMLHLFSPTSGSIGHSAYDLAAPCPPGA